MESGELNIRKIDVIRYITPLREGGSLPAIVEGSDGLKYVLKFRGAGQGTKALIADLIGAELARAAGLKVPFLALAQLDEGFGRTEPDEEIQDLLKFSTGLNLGVYYLSGAITYDPLVYEMDGLLASKIVWLDAYITNIDRTVKNTNMLYWNRKIWLIDHGASLYFHHNIESWHEQTLQPFSLIKDHVLLPFADKLEEADRYMRSMINTTVIDAIIDLIPEEFISTEIEKVDVAERRDIYRKFLSTRLQNSAIFLKEAIDAREALI